jgi:predicted transcriptional regulator
MNANLSNNELDRRRDRLYIMAEILEVTLEGALKTQVMYRANLSFAQLNQYLTLLLDIKLLERKENKEKTVYKTTTKGMHFLESYKQILDMLKKTEETNDSNGQSSKNGNHSVFLVNRGSHVVCKETP